MRHQVRVAAGDVQQSRSIQDRQNALDGLRFDIDGGYGRQAAEGCLRLAHPTPLDAGCGEVSYQRGALALQDRARRFKDILNSSLAGAAEEVELKHGYK